MLTARLRAETLRGCCCSVPHSLIACGCCVQHEKLPHPCSSLSLSLYIYLSLCLSVSVSVSPAVLMRSLLDNRICHATFAVKRARARRLWFVACNIMSRCIIRVLSFGRFSFCIALRCFHFRFRSPAASLWLSLGPSVSFPLSFSPPLPISSHPLSTFHLILVHFNVFCSLFCAASASFAAASLSLIFAGAADCATMLV